MNKIDAYIQENRSQFNAEEPPKGHLKRFKAKLDAQQPAARVNLWLVASAAAVAGVILTASLSLMLNFGGLTSPRESDLVSVSLSPEIMQVDEFYQNQVNQKQQVITRMMTGDMSHFEQEISQTLNEFNDGYSSLLQDIAHSPRPDRAAFVLTRYYQTQLDVLDGIILRMQNVRTYKTQF
ncbi:MAG: hypothetical protein ACLFNU_10440 [Bacteroidales bacterium]